MAKLEETIRELEMEISVNEMLPPGMRCDNAIQRMKDQLARLRERTTAET